MRRIRERSARDLRPKDLPLNVSGSSRSAASFVVILPGVNTGAGSNPFETRINGGMKMGDEAALDGASMQEGLMSQSEVVAIHSDYPISPEAISEVSVLTSTYEPQYGTTTSGVITMVTKSGTNQFHGDLREYLHNNALNATQWGSPNKPKDIENQFGGSLGGPIKIPGIWSNFNKAFFFVNVERWTIRGGTVFPIVSIPSLKERQGDFSDWTDSSGNLIPIYDPATTTANPAYDPNQPQGPTNLPFFRQQFMGCDGPHPNVICSTDPRLTLSLANQWFRFSTESNLRWSVEQFRFTGCELGISAARAPTIGRTTTFVLMTTSARRITLRPTCTITTQCLPRFRHFPFRSATRLFYCPMEARLVPG